MQIRKYQQDQVQRTIDAIERYRTVLVQLPTGGGKTVEFAQIIKEFIVHKNVDIDPGPVLILVHRQELLHQAARSVAEILGWQPCLITSETSQFFVARVYIGMVESTLSRLHLINKPSLIIVDECHIQNFNKVHNQFPEAKFIGFSATPISASKKEPMKKYYDTIITGPSIKDLINEGYLSQNLTRAPKTSIDPTQFEYDRFIGDYNQRQMAAAYRMHTSISNAFESYWKYCKKKKTLIFNVNIEHSKEVAEYFNTFRIECRHLDATCKDRDEIFKWFKETPGAVMSSVMIPTMGYDEPTIETIMLNFSTLSLPKFLQTCGRGSRIIDDYFIEKHHSEYRYEVQKKDHFDIIDLGSNWKNFGDWNDERDWRDIFYYPDQPGNGIAPVKKCPQCESLVHAAVRICPHCDYEFQRRNFKQQDLEEMILITKGIDVNVVNERAEKKYKYYPMFDMATDIVANMFFIHGQNPGQEIVNKYFRAYFLKCAEWYKKTHAIHEEEIDDISESMWHINKARNNFNALIYKRNKQSKIVEQEGVRDLLHPDYPNNIKEKQSSWSQYHNENFTV